jgi:arsenite-transporting ATPase
VQRVLLNADKKTPQPLVDTYWLARDCLRGVRAARLQLGAPFAPPPDRTLYLVGGKGGVGKSTAAAALALHLTDRGTRPVLLLGTDPAGSLGDLFGTAVGPEPAALPDAPSLRVQQIDAPAAWADFRERYREEARQLFDSLAGGLSIEADRAVVERLVDLAPPGVDELMALLEVVDASEDRPYDPLVVDTAPTGHLLRLLELPDLALDWAHALLRLLLKYRDVVGLGPLADRVLQLSRSFRSFRERLGDPERSWFLVVARPESLSVPETERLLAGLDRLHVPVGALLVNRFAEGRDEDLAEALVHAAGSLSCAAAPALPAGPRGVAELSRFADSWRLLALAPDRTQ